MEKVLDILTRLTFESNPEEVAEVNKHITKQTNLVKELETKIQSLNKERKKSGLAVEDYKRINTELDKSKKALDNLNGSYKEQTGIIERLTAKQRSLQEQMRSATSVKDIKRYNEELGKTNKELASLTSSGGGAGSTLKNMVGGFGLALVAAKALTEGIQFLNNSFEEFEQSEKAINSLKLSLSNFGKQKYLADLTKQADDLSKSIGYLDNDDIVKAQNKLVTFGKLSINQIKALTPVIVDYAAKTEKSIDAATDAIIVGLEGSGREFKKLGVSFADGKTTAENYKTVMTDVFGKVKGAAEDFGNTMEGQSAKTTQALKDLEEETGRRLAPVKRAWLEWKLSIISSISDTVDYMSNFTDSKGLSFNDRIERFIGIFMPSVRINEQRRQFIEESKREAEGIINQYKKESALKRLFSSSKNTADELINPNADTELKEARKEGDGKKEILNKIRAAEEATALRVIELNNQVKTQRVKGEDESIEKIKDRIRLERNAELEKLNFERARNVKNGINSPVLNKNYNSLESGINTLYDVRESQEIKAFNEKNGVEIDRFNAKVLENEIALIKGKSELNKQSVDLQLQLIDKQKEKELKASSEKYSELIAQAKKYNQDYSELVKQREEEAALIKEKAKKDKLEATEKFTQEQFDAIRKITNNNRSSSESQTIGDLIGLSDEDIDNIMRGIDVSQELTSTILSGISQVLAAEIDKEQKLIDKQKERVQNATELAKKGNSTILKAETERLQKQEEAQQKRLRSQRAINAALVASQSAVNAAQAIGAVLGAASEGDPYTIALRVVAAVASIVAGVAATTAAVRSAGQTDTGFFDGDYTGDGNPRDVAGVVHKQEFVYTAKQTQAIGKENLRYIAKNELKPMMLKDGSMVLSKTGNIDYTSIQEGFMANRTPTPVFETKKLENKIDTLVDVMSSIGIDVSVDENGLAIRAAKINLRNLKMKNL